MKGKLQDAFGQITVSEKLKDVTREYLTLSEYDSTLTVEACTNMTMGEMHDRICHYRQHNSDPGNCNGKCMKKGE